MTARKKQTQVELPTKPVLQAGEAAWTRYKFDADDGEEAWALLWDGGEVAIVENRLNGESWTARTANALGGEWVHCETRNAAML